MSIFRDGSSTVYNVKKLFIDFDINTSVFALQR